MIPILAEMFTLDAGKPRASGDDPDVVVRRVILLP